MKKSKVLAAALAATMFTTAACGLVACGDDVDASKTYTITFDADGGTLDGAQTLKTDVNGIVKGVIPTAEKADTTFKGWSLSNGDTSIINFKSQKFTGDKIVYAVYESNGVGEVTITFDYGEGTGTPASAPTVNGKLQSLPTPEAPQDYVFDGWYTAATGGEYITTNTNFTQSVTIYAHYKSTIAELNNYCMVGNNKYTLTATTIAGAQQAYTATVQLNVGDTISFYVDEELIEAWRSTIWIGMAQAAEKTSEFTAARQGTFEFKLGYYPATADSEATWSLEGDDGVIAFHADHYYLVGGDYGWTECSEDGYIGETSGEFELTVGETPVAFKLAKCSSSKLGTILWDDSVLGINAVTTGSGYVSTDSSSNIVLATAGTYTIKLVDGNVEISSDNVEEPPITILAGHYYFVGGELGFDRCVEAGYIGATSGEIEVTVAEDADEPFAFKIVKCANVVGGIDWDNALGAGDVSNGLGYISASGAGDIILKYAGTYTIKLVDGKIEITNEDMEEPPVTIFINHYYFVGGDLGWTACVEDGYLGATSGEIEVIVAEDAADTENPFAFKIVKCNSLTGGIDWSSALGRSAVTVGRGYVTTDSDGNLVIKKAGTYTIKLVDGTLEITSDNVEEEIVESLVDNSNLTFEECAGNGAWIVGVIQEKDQTWATGWGNGFKMERADEGDKEQYKIVVELQAGDEVKIRYNHGVDSDGIGYDQIENKADLSCIEDAGGNYSITETGTYTFYFKFNWQSNKVYVTFEPLE